MKHIQTFESINEASKFTFSEAEIKNVADTYSDYPKAATKNAQQAIDWKEKYGRDEVTAATRVGWARAHQLAKGENLSADTVKRMSAFNRHRKNSKIDTKYKDTPWKDNGYVAWLTWGGDEGVDWAIKTSKEILNEGMLNEGGMSDMYLLAQEAKDEASFLKEFFKDFGDKVKKTTDSVKWAKSIYADAMEMALESAIQEGTLIDLRLVNENVEDEIESALTTWLNTLADGNAVAMSDLYLDNGVLIGTLAEDIKQGREQIQGYFERFLKSSPVGSVDSFILQNYGDVCISDGAYTLEMDTESGSRESVGARYTYVWKKENKKWMIATQHSSANPK